MNSVKNEGSARYMNNENAVIYIVSDFTGETAELVAKAAVAQYPKFDMKMVWIPYITDKVIIEDIIKKAKNVNSIIMFTIVAKELKDYLVELAVKNNITYVDIMEPAISAISKAIKSEPTYKGVMRKLDKEYFDKVEAIEFAVRYDDCKDPRGIKKADLVLLGISRTSKTPLSMYLATKNIKVANIPLLPEVKPPKELYDIAPETVIGLTTDPHKLNAIRLERLKAHGLNSDANYASLERIAYEYKYAEEIMKSIGCKIIDVTDKAIEETASTILQILKEVIR